MRRLNTALGVVTIAGLAVGCGPIPSPGYPQDRSAQQIVFEATTSSGSAYSYHVILDEATAYGVAHVELDVEGANARGRIAWPSMSLRITQVGGRTFVNGSDLALLLAPVDVDGAALIKAAAGDRWVLVPAGFWHSRLTDLIDMQNLGVCINATGRFATKGTSNVSGRMAVEVDGGSATKLYVDTAGPHYLVHADITGAGGCITSRGATRQTFGWSSYGANFDITAPTGYADMKTIG